MRKGNFVKRKHSPQKDDVSSSSANEEEQGQSIQVHIKKNPHQGKKLKERSSPPTSENEDKMAVDGNCDPEDMSKKEEAASTGYDNPKDITSSSFKEINQTESLTSKEQQEQHINIEKTKSEAKPVSSVADKMNILSSGKNVKPKKNLFAFDFLGDEVSSDESQALQALSSFWVTTVARNKNVLKRPPPKNKKEEDFYNKYCDKQGKLSINAATRLMRLPHVITVCLKTTAQIEVVVANKDKALEESEELREDFFEVVEAMAMHLM